jgi:hypothetical protein
VIKGPLEDSIKIFDPVAYTTAIQIQNKGRKHDASKTKLLSPIKI